jgi:uncharacterized protein YqgC (DUF456 family)
MITMRAALARPPQEAGVLRSIGPVLARFSSIGLVLMLATGVALVLVKYDGFASLPLLFWVKMAFVTTLTLAAITLELIYAAIRRGHAQAAARLPLFGPIAGSSSLLATLFAVLAFH